jgi:hypothetical protein
LPPGWRCALAVAFILLVSSPALAWNAAGHRLVACIAWDHLDRRTRSAVAQLLREHPDYRRWIKRARDDDPERAAFVEASTWPDEIRKDNRFYSAGVDEATPTLPGFPDMERHLDWHYVNRPLDAARRERAISAISGRLDRQLAVLADTVGASAASRAERSYALPWLIHLSGDAHQPLHTSIKLDAEGQWDKLGNGLVVNNPFNPRKSSSTLHAYWDDLPGPRWLRGERLDAACRALAAFHPRPAQAAPAQWIDESWQLARSSAYPPGDEKTPTISADFHENATAIADRRITDAGYRLAGLLRDLFSRKRSTHDAAR